MKVLIFGKKGQVAWELQKALSDLPSKKFLSSEEVNFLNPESIVKAIQDFQPTHIINASAYTAVDKAEIEPESAMMINAKAVGIISETAKKVGSTVIHYSTDYIFDGKKDKPYVEEDIPSPLNMYGKSKLQGEKNLQQSGLSYIILRVSWVYGNHGNNFCKTMLKLGKEKEELKIVSDQIGTPTWSRNIANTTSLILRDKDLTEKAGVYHFTDAGETSWYEFAKKIFHIEEGLHPGRYKNLKSILPIKTSDYKSSAQRPLNSRMNTDKIKKVFGIKTEKWDESLKKVLQEV